MELITVANFATQKKSLENEILKFNKPAKYILFGKDGAKGKPEPVLEFIPSYFGALSSQWEMNKDGTALSDRGFELYLHAKKMNENERIEYEKNEEALVAYLLSRLSMQSRMTLDHTYYPPYNLNQF